MRRTVILCSSLFAGCCFAFLAFADVPVRTLTPEPQWPQWRGADRSGMSPDTGLLTDWNTQQPKLLWTAEGMGSGYASATVAGGRVYTTGNQDHGQAVVCIDAADGKVIWTKIITDMVPKHQYEGSRCSPSLDGDRLYAIASSGKIACLKTADGSEIWSRDFKDWGGRMMSGWGFSESPLVDGDWVLCTPGATSAMIVALDKLTGQEVWHSELPPASGKDGAAYSSIVISNACGVKQYVQLIGRGVIGVRASDGKFLWSYADIANRTANIPTPLVTGDYVFCSTGYGTGAALLKLTKAGDDIKCEEQYFLSGDKAQNHHGQMILKDGYVYFGHRHGNGFPICVELLTGKIMWGGDQRGPGSGSAAICYADGHLYFRYQSGEVALIEATPTAYHLQGTFKPPHVSPPCWAQPVVIGGRLYLRDQDKLMCYDVRAK
jgi:outer membrane protein assembly factor BamB